MKVEIEIEKNGEDESEDMDKSELNDKQKMALGKKLKKNMMLTRMERKLLSEYLLKEDES